MIVRGAPLIGATAAYGLALALRDDPSDAGLEAAGAALLATSGRLSVVRREVVAIGMKGPLVASRMNRARLTFENLTVKVATPGGLGSGVILNADGYAVTNAHVIQGETNLRVTVWLPLPIV